ncbi:MAG: hypothetical protein WAK28_26705 [Trebonia sp.]
MIPRAAPVTLDTTGTQDTPGRQGVQMLDHALAEPYWLDDLDLAQRHLAREYAPVGCLIEANPITVGGVRGMAQLYKRPVPGQEHGLVFGVAVFLAKTTQTANIMYFVDEIGATGAREVVVWELRMREAAGLDKVGHPGFLGGRDLWESWGSWHHGSRIPRSCGNARWQWSSSCVLRQEMRVARSRGSAIGWA